MSDLIITEEIAPSDVFVRATTKPAKGKYTPGYAKKCYDLMSEGKSATFVAAALGITRDSLYKWANPKSDMYHPEFREAFRRGRTACQAYQEELYQDIIEGKRKGNAGAQLQNLARRFRKSWGETIKNEVKVTNKAEGLSKEELDKQVMSLLQRKK